MRQRLFILAVAALLTACQGTTFRSAVPDYPIHLEINTRVGMFVSFVPGNITSHVIVDAGGFHFNGITQPLTVQDAYGFAGTVVYIDASDSYAAYDLCCPHCLKRDVPCTIDGMFAVCSECGEQYDIYSGNGVPTRGIAKEPLKRYNCTYNTMSGIVFVTPRR